MTCTSKSRLLLLWNCSSYRFRTKWNLNQINIEQSSMKKKQQILHEPFPFASKFFFLVTTGSPSNLNLIVETPRPPDFVIITIGPGLGFLPSHGCVTHTSLAGVWYSKVSRWSTEHIVKPRKSLGPLPKLHPRMVIFVPPLDGPNL